MTAAIREDAVELDRLGFDISAREKARRAIYEATRASSAIQALLEPRGELTPADRDTMRHLLADVAQQTLDELGAVGLAFVIEEPSPGAFNVWIAASPIARVAVSP